MRRIRPEQHNSGLFRRASKTAVSEMSQSMMDLSVHADTNHDEQGVSVPRFKGRVSVCSSQLTEMFNSMNSLECKKQINPLFK